MECRPPESGNQALLRVTLWLPNRRILKMHRILPLVLIMGLLCRPVTTQAQSSANNCDVNGDGAVNVVDVQLAVNMALGQTACMSFVNGPRVCNAVVVQRVVNAALGSTCLVNPHSVALAWPASTSLNVAGYNVYRGTASGGPYTKLNSSPVATLSYADATVQAGSNYYYVTTTVDSSGNESGYSTEVHAVVPTP